MASKTNVKTEKNNKVNNTNKTNKNTQIMSKFIIAKIAMGAGKKGQSVRAYDVE